MAIDPATLSMLSSLLGSGGGGGGGGGGGSSIGKGLVASVPELYKMGTAIGQLSKAKKFAKHDRPIYDIPQSMEESVATIRSLAGDPYLPGQDLMEDSLSAATARGVGAATETAQDPASALAAITSMYGSEMEGVREIGVSAAQNYTANQSALASVLQNYATYEDKKWQTNKMEPYQNAMDASRRLQELGQSNMYGSLSGLSEIGQSMMGSGGSGDSKGSSVNTSKAKAAGNASGNAIMDAIGGGDASSLSEIFKYFSE